jgi:hypothetical protein
MVANLRIPPCHPGQSRKRRNSQALALKLRAPYLYPDLVS